MILNSPYISGSLTVTGNTTIQGQLTVTGSLSGTASLASNALLLQGTGSTGFATTASVLQVSSSQQEISSSLLQVSASYTALSGSYNTFSGSASTRITVDSASLLQVSASYIALSGSYTTFSGSASTRVTQIENVYATTGSNSFRADQSITGSLVVSSTITAQTLIVQTVTSSIIYSSGSNNFGNQLANTQTFTGSVNITGSLTVNTTGTEFQVTNNGVVMGNLLTDAHSVTGSLRVTGSNHYIFGNVLIGSTNAAGTERFGVTRDDGVTDGLHIIADFNRSGASSAELILGYYASGSAVTGPVVYASNSQPLLFAAGAQERMRITSAGNVGIATYNPNIGGYGANSRVLTVQGVASSYAILELTSDSANADGSAIGRLDFGSDGQAANYKAISSISSFLNGSTSTKFGADLRFYTRANNAASGDPSERMRITSAGHIGINTSSPVSTSLTGSITIYKSYNADQASVPSTTAQAYYGNQHGLYLFGRNSGLTIVSANSEEGSIKFGNASTNAYATIATSTGTSAVGGDMYFRVGSDTERLRITSGGNVGIGTTSPTSTSSFNKFLEINGGSVNSALCLSGLNTAGQGTIGYDSGNLYIEALGNPTGTNNNILFSTTSVNSSFTRIERMRITSGGNVLIGTTTDSAGVRLKVSGGIIGCLDVYNNTTGVAANVNIDANGFFARSTSSLKYKTDVKDYTKGLNEVMQMRPVFYKGKTDGDKQFAGLIAEDIHELGLTEFVQYAEDGSPDALSYSNMVALLIKGIQEQQKQIETQQQQINSLINK